MHNSTSNPTLPNLYKGIVFDLDGTLLNTLHCIATAFNSALEQLDFPTHQSTDFRAFIGDGVFKCAERALPMEARNEATITELVALEREIYEATWMVAAIILRCIFIRRVLLPVLVLLALVGPLLVSLATVFAVGTCSSPLGFRSEEVGTWIGNL